MEAFYVSIMLFTNAYELRCNIHAYSCLQCISMACIYMSVVYICIITITAFVIILGNFSSYCCVDQFYAFINPIAIS